MTGSARKRITAWLGVAAAIAVTAAAVLYVRNQGGPELPQVDLSTMEARVATQIRMRNSAVTADPESAQAWADLARTLHAHDLFPQAIRAYRRAMEIQPGDARWPYLAALAQAKSDPEASLPLFERAVGLSPANAAVHINHGDVLMALGRHPEAEAAYQQALAIDEQSSHALYGLAQAALVANDPATAVSLLERAESISPYHGEVHGLLAQAYQRQGNGEAAQRQAMLAGTWSDATRAPDPVAQAMEELAVDSQSIALRGVSLARRGEYEAAEAAFREVLEIRPGNARDYANLGGALAGQGEIQEAIGAYLQGLEIDPSNVDLLNNLGYTYLRAGEFDAAERYLEQAHEADPGFAEVLGNLGLLAEQQQQAEEAIAYFEQALELDPGLLFARNALAAQLAGAGQSEAAIGHWRNVLEIDPNELTATYNLAATLAAQGDHAEAIDLLRRGLAIAPNGSRLVAALAWELATAPEEDLRNGEEAVQMASRVFTAFPRQPQMVDIMAAALAEAGRFGEAVELMEALSEGQGQLSPAMAMRLKAYRSEQPWRQSGPAGITVAPGLGGQNPR